jgi:hypothetical protein
MELLTALVGAIRRGHLRNEATRKQFGETNVIKHTEKCRLRRRIKFERMGSMTSPESVLLQAQKYEANWKSREKKMVRSVLSLGLDPSGRILAKAGRRRRSKGNKN